MTEKIDYVTCSKCGKRVSNKTGKELIIRAWVECPECLIGATGSPFELGTTQWKTFRWANYIFNFACKDDGTTLIESAMRITQPVDYIPSLPILRPGLILTDEQKQNWQVTYMEPMFIPPSRLKGAGRFDPPDGIYSPYGWTILQYKKKSVA